MNTKRAIRDGLAAATCALIGGGSASAAREIDASLLYYTEGERITVNEAVLHFTQPLRNDRRLDFDLTVDVLTGASPNGGVPSPEVQTFTRPSGLGGYRVPAGSTPLDDTFQDSRFGASASFLTPLGDRASASLGARTSIEYDYRSFGGEARVTRDFNKRNTTFALGISFARDRIRPEGRIPVPFASMAAPGTSQPRLDKTDDKTVIDALAGVTQVIDRSTVARVNYAYSRARGYLTDPFKIMSVVAAPGDVQEGVPVDYVYERRPRDRDQHTLYGVVKRHIGDDNVLDVSYRYAWDDWGVRSHTVETRFRRGLGGGRYLQPQLRYYRQSAADFHTPFLIDGAALPDYASAEYRLGQFDAFTVAFKYGVAVGETREVNVRLGYYLQMGDSSPPEAYGSLREFDLFPTVDAYIVQIGYSNTLR